ncbi:DNA helicase UvrD [Candidatus Wolfebacteria bacterium]|nr:DNA helicase UvrD [Candidatus Wolfebacteria bacterium]
MKFIADLHIHSKYSRATSKNLNLEELDRWADDKGVLVIGTGDFTHPEWFREIKEKLEPAEPGLLKLKSKYKLKTIKGTLAQTRFFLTSEISSIYSREGKCYRNHNLIFAPDIETVEKINTQLGWVGNLKSDGRPILGLDVRELAKIVLNTDPRAYIVPAHIWTPWFSMFGSMSGFDSIEECFGDYAKNIFAGETGLSSDPAMNWRLSQLDNIALISNSDSHSLQRIGREANIFDTELSYDGIIEAIKSGAPSRRKEKKNKEKFIATIEFFPEEGKYHYDGHRNCNVVFSPKETKKHNGICPKCGKKVTIGVMNRIEELADRPEIKTKSKGYYQFYDNLVPFYNLIPLDEVIADVYNMGVKTKKVKEQYDKLIKNFGSELRLFLDTEEDEIKRKADSNIYSAIKALKEKKLKIEPGFDGEYGKISIFGEKTKKETEVQKSLF